MTPREYRILDTREWLKRGTSDRVASAALIGEELPAEALFHAQQCAEKALKAFLTWHQTPFRKTHNLEELKQLCLPFVTTPSMYLENVNDLSKYAWRFRYPGAPYEPQREEAEEALRRASGLLDEIVSQLETEFNRE